MNLFRNIILLCRPHQYVKNLFVLVPLFFSGNAGHLVDLEYSLLAFVFYSLAASSIYIFNDYMDRDVDRKHPKKKSRPLASGAVSSGQAAVIGVLLLFASIAGSLLTLPDRVAYILAAYAVLNTAYSVWLKHIPILDVSVIGVGFVLRLFAGAFAIDVTLSMWIIIMTYLLSVFLGLAKRRDDVLIQNTTGEKMRRVVDGYNLEFVNSAMTMMGAVVIVSYILYTISEESIAHWQTENMYLSSIFVVLGIMRYLQISFVEERSGNPTRILIRDRLLQLILLLWIITFAWVIY